MKTVLGLNEPKTKTPCHDCPGKKQAVKPPIFSLKKVHLVTAAMLISGHYIKAVEIAELVRFTKDIFGFILGLKGK